MSNSRKIRDKQPWHPAFSFPKCEENAESVADLRNYAAKFLETAAESGKSAAKIPNSTFVFSHIASKITDETTDAGLNLNINANQFIGPA